MTTFIAGTGRELLEARGERAANPNPQEDDFEAGWNAALREAATQIKRLKYFRKDKPGQMLFDLVQADAILVLAMLQPKDSDG